MAGQKEKNALAEVYARSLMELCMEQGGLSTAQQVQEEVDALEKAVREDLRFGEFLRSRIIATEAKADSLGKMFQGRLSDLTLRFLLVLNKKERLDQLEAVAHAFRQMLWAQTGRIEVEVFTARPMDEAQRSDVRNRIMAAMGKEPVIENTIDPSMIGGIRLRIGDQLIDGSIATRLAQVRESLTRSGAEAIRTKFDSMLG